MKTLKLPVLAIAAITMLMLLSACVASNGNSNGTPGKYDNFAKCLTEKGVKMYGAYWCSHCKSQKEAFGSSFGYIDYIECDPGGKNAKPKECVAAGVRGYPTWIFNGQSYPGEQSLEKLSALSGCAIETENQNETNN